MSDCPVPQSHAPLTRLAGSARPAAPTGPATDRFVAIYEQHYRRIAAHIYRRLGQRDATDELTAEVFLAAFRNRRQFRGDVGIEFWLLGIATFTVSRHLRRRTLERRTRALLAPLFPTHAAPDRSADSRDELRHTRAAIDSLPASQQAVVSLHCLEGIPLKEVAKTLAIAEGTAKSRLSRARATLRQVLDRRSTPWR